MGGEKAEPRPTRRRNIASQGQQRGWRPVDFQPEIKRLLIFRQCGAFEKIEPVAP